MKNNIELKPVDVGWGPNKRPPIVNMPVFTTNSSTTESCSIKYENVPPGSVANNSNISSSSSTAVDEMFCDVNSLNYENYESGIFKRHVLRRKHQQLAGSRMGWLDALCNSAGGILNNMNAKRWLITYGIGACCGIIAYCVATSTSVLLRTKFSVFNSFIEKEKTGEVPYGTAFLFYLMSNVIFGYIAWFVVFIEPSAKGSGIPEIKCFLNGIDVDGIVDMKTLWFKMVGIVFSVSSGLPLGKEGPMVHAGAIVAASISQGYCCEGCLKCCAQKTPTGRRENGGMFSDFKNDKEKRDFVTCGTGAGLAAAFGAPIGGVLFALEEASSFWSTKLTWKSFFCAMTSVFTAMFLSSMGSRVGEYAMFSFGEFYSLTGEIANYSMWELFVFLMIGAAGGVLGALFVRCNSYICKYRKATIVTDKQRLLEVLLVVIGFTCISFLLPLFWNSCSRIPTEVAQWTEQERQLASQLVPLYCKQGSEYNELGSLFLTDGDTAIKQLFHFKELGNGQDDSTIRGSALLMFFVVYVAVFCITCGLTMAAGMFVPSLLAGACFGRIVGHLLHVFDASHGTFADAGTYALMGAAAFTSGITRITISLSIMILEATGDMQYVLPLMITTLTAQYVGNVCSVGMDDMKIESMSFPYLVEEEQLGNDHNGRYDRSVGCEGVTDIMSKNVVVLEPVVSVEHVLSVLRTHKHNCFPVVVRNNSHGNANTNANIGESEEEGDSRIFLGTISRDILCSLLLHKAYTTPLKTDSGTNTVWGAKSNSRSSAIETDEDELLLSRNQQSVTEIEWNILVQQHYPRFPRVTDHMVKSASKEGTLDLHAYMDMGAYTVNENATFQRTYRMFRSLGLRNIVVTNRFNEVVGMVTRTDLLKEKFMQ